MTSRSEMADSFDALLREVARAPAVAPVELDATGATLGRFEVRGRLGEGGMGVVYEAWDTRLHRPVALKLLRPRHGSMGKAERVHAEARRAAAIVHPNVAAVYDVVEHEGVVFLALELVRGRSLRDVLRAGSMTACGSLEYARQIAAGLAEAHRLGVVHRDLKPDNVMVRADGVVKLLDFGLATETSSAHAPTAAGTPGYMAPEQREGAHVDARADVFSFGVLLQELLAGDRSADGAFLRGELRALGRRCAAAERGLRPRDGAELATLLESARAREGCAGGRRRTYRAACAIAAAGVAVLVALAVSHGPGEPREVVETRVSALSPAPARPSMAMAVGSPGAAIPSALPTAATSERPSVGAGDPAFPGGAPGQALAGSTERDPAGEGAPGEAPAASRAGAVASQAPGASRAAMSLPIVLYVDESGEMVARLRLPPQRGGARALGEEGRTFAFETGGTALAPSQGEASSARVPASEGRPSGISIDEGAGSASTHGAASAIVRLTLPIDEDERRALLELLEGSDEHLSGQGGAPPGGASKHATLSVSLLDDLDVPLRRAVLCLDHTPGSLAVWFGDDGLHLQPVGGAGAGDDDPADEATFAADGHLATRGAGFVPCDSEPLSDSG